MRILIIEDEKHTANHLESLVKAYDSNIEVMAILDSVENSLKWFRENDAPDLIFQDIQLGDGLCFEIYEQQKIEAPIVFTTAFSEYALKSFELNSIAYVVKPYDKEDIAEVFKKYGKMKSHFSMPENQLLENIISQKKTIAKRRFLIKIGENYQVLPTDQIAFIIFEYGLSFAYNLQNEKFPLDLSMNDLVSQLDENEFFRINRKCIVHSSSIKKISSWFNARLKIETSPKEPTELIVSREKVKEFKDWLNN
ncbi:LytTR family DNA-binding domain-containing protein [Lentimicrobium sp. S6]|uniref:LytR/AlgR family response regulator transcription factor n=1 Tax=Lentimicrobium sp. S6 TaxID=2735872 RepID=UPI001556FF7E|nr:LytTR family DNA-binding domain-containing protein [Lentimicrobium sp. S6]NPD45855.1 response regulator transcription factor [Lentimicrobium sp. S6]